MEQPDETPSEGTKVGRSSRDKMDKTVVVRVENGHAPALPGLHAADSSKFMAHDEENAVQPGDRVEIVSSAGRCRPPSAGGCGSSSGRGSGEAVMIQMGTMLDVADNSGAKKLPAIRQLGGSTAQVRRLGDIITASVKEAAPDGTSRRARWSRRSSCAPAGSARNDGSYIRFDENAAVLVNDAGEPIGTRVFGPVARELRERRFMKIVSLAPEVLRSRR
jgi:large subunit ribosomal protein L14